jgi:hypothetical protein
MKYLHTMGGRIRWFGCFARNKEILCASVGRYNKRKKAMFSHKQQATFEQTDKVKNALDLRWIPLVIALLVILFVADKVHAQTSLYLQDWESGVGGWFGRLGAGDPVPLAQDPSAPSPTTVQQITRSYSGGDYFSPLIPLQGGHTYCISGWVRWVGGGWPFIGIDNYNASGEALGENWLIGLEGHPTGYGDTVTPVPADTTYWHQYRKTITLRSDTVSVRMKDELWDHSVKPGGDLGFFDDLTVNDGPCPLPDHFLCYKAKPANGSEKFVPRTVSLADQFNATARNFDVTKPLSLCNPADKKDEGITDPNTHLKGYEIKLTTTDPRQTPDIKHTVRVTNQFGILLLDTLRSDRLLVPTAKSLTEPVDPPGPNNVDHYKCYKVRRSKGTPKFKPILGVSVSDQFIGQPPKLFDITKPTRLCNPVDKNGEGIKNYNAHLMCYQAKPTKGQPRHQPISPIFVNNQFGPELLQTIKEEDLCVPSTKTVLGTLGAVSDAEDDLEE